MFGFLLKVAVVAGIVVFAYTYISSGKINSLPISSRLNFSVSDLKQIDTQKLGQQVGLALDNLVTHPDANSPVVLGLKVSNDSVSSVVDFIQNMSPSQVDQIKAVICTPQE